ncbi:LysR family transcriptional regulator [Photobacterium angustum]|uniref:LysR family transcriptional regulator n=1 Tax=Photobacterium angustum TaxID=661 RepID=A0ABX5GYI0_PHOAN|nr:LysR family transcriptional regulator [Photobacterium angustum]KJG35066.1 LysR family transcriptional regulator [Photobacterium angustum]PSX01832.1 LysR family transcriptional regulator [Photobacterium angustum]
MSNPLSELDLNLIRLLKAVVDHKSIKLAAMQLGISQPSASRGVVKLKQFFNDPLFVRKAHGVEPSPLAIRLASEFDNILAPIEKVLLEFSDFKPTEYRGSIAIVVDPYVMDEHGQHLLSCCHRAFPLATLVFSNWDSSSQLEMLDGKFDYCILDQETAIAKDIYMQPLFREKRVILAKQHHPTLRIDQNDWPQVATLPLVSLPAPTAYKPLCTVESEYQRMGYEPQVLLKTFNLRVACQMLLETNAIMFASESTADLMPELHAYPMPNVNRNFSHFVVSGGYLQTHRNYPLYKHLHQVLQATFR